MAELQNDRNVPSREDERRLADALFENPVVGVRIAAVADGRIVRANATFRRMLGYPEEELRRRTFLDLTHPDDVAADRRAYESVVSGRLEAAQIEKRYVRKDGSTFWGRLTVYALPEAEGPPRLLVGLVEDVDERRAAEKARLESARRLEAVLESAVDAVVTIAPDGTVQSVNAATARMFGYAADELVGRNVKVLMPAPYREEHDGYLARYLATGEPRIIGIGREVEGRRKDGTVFPVDLAVSEVRVGDERIFVGVIRDLSERKLLEASLLQSQKMEAVGRLAGGVAHDFNTILGTIQGYSEMLLAEVAEAPELRRQVERIHQAARRGADLTRQLLAFSRRQETQPRLVALDALMAETGQMIRRLIGEDITLVDHVEQGLGAVSADPGQLQQVVLNLAVNAADAMPRGGRLSIAWTRRELHHPLPTAGGSLAPGGYAVLEVADTGHGMDEATMQRIFEPFFTTKPTGRGTGLGLSTVFGIVRQWDGGILVESRPGEGTRFEIYFPEAGPHAAAVAPPPPAVPAPRTPVSECVLLVEDDPMFRGLVQEVLTGAGYRVLAAGDPPEALDLCAASGDAIDVLVSDLVMPGGTGVDLAAAIRSLHPRAKIVLMSGYSDDALADRDLHEAVADAFLEKPFAVIELLQRLRAVLA